MLNLDTGKYHGVNPTGGRMIEVLESVDSVVEAAALLVEEFNIPREQLESDISIFIQDLMARGLLVRDAG